MNHVITITEKHRENKELLLIKNVDKTSIAKVAKVFNVIDLKNKHSWAINNAHIDATGDWKLINIKNT